MAGMVHALLVGIDNYPRPENSLSGCRNDVTEFEQLLRAKVQPAALKFRTMLDEQALHDAVIQAFRDDLGQAGAGDTALFFYAGHGSQERTPVEFLAVEPDGLDETLVLWDSREPGKWDLADKELAALIREVAARGAFVAIILDCCHSGSGTRRPADESAPKVRRYPQDSRIRPLETLLPQARGGGRRPLSESGWELEAEGRHILLAACRDDQEAAEYSVEGRKRGAFSWFLMEALRQAPATVTYRDLAAIARARACAALSNQTPQIEATDDADLDRVFLGAALPPPPRTFLAAEQADGWWIDGGRIHGIPVPKGSECASIALFSATASAADMRDMAKAAALAEIVEVAASSSRLNIVRGSAEAGAQYKALLVGVPLPLREVVLSGDAAALSQARAALASSTEMKEVVSGGRFLLECQTGEFRIRSSADGRMLTAPASSAAEAVTTLDHIARWMHLSELENPVTQIDEAEFKVTIFEGRAGNTEMPGRDLRFESARTGQGLIAREFRLSLENHSQRDLYFAVLALDELFSCTTNLIPSGVVRLRPGDSPAWALNGKALKGEIPAALRGEGRTESRDILKVIVSTANFEIRQAALSALRAPAVSGKRGIPGNTLDRLLARSSQTRTISSADDHDMISDFRTWTVAITTVEPPAGVSLTSAAAVDVGRGVRIEPHPGFTATARLVPSEQTRSDLGASILPPLFRSSPEQSETIAFSTGRGAAPGLSVLQLDDIANYESVTREFPLFIHLPQALVEGDVVLPLGFDGEDYLILGRAVTPGAETTVEIERLPHPVQKGKRSLTGSIRILFRKFSHKIFNTAYVYPILAAATWDAGGKVHFERDAAIVKSKAAAARRIVVFVHGIIGDTFAMGAKIPPDEGDLFLTFDYENLNTTIEQNAFLLKQALTSAGLGEGHGRKMVIIAHSMGGLISRWFIEALGGSKSVSHLILCGTPNAGSPWSTVEECVTALGTLAINNLTKLSWEGAVVGHLFSSLPRVDNSLKQMKAGCELLTNLAAAGDPGIPYTILAGNNSLADAAAGGRIARVLKKALYAATAPAFLFAPNDIAVSVASIESVSANRVPAPRKVETACDHLTYFSSDKSVAELKALLR